jgi:hypothetical protein
MGQTVIEVVLGAIVAIVITIVIENLRKPKLVLEIEKPTDADYRDRQNYPVGIARYLCLNLINKPLPRWARWMTRNPALQCHGQITFHHLDGQNVFGRSMPIRWSGSPEPIALPLVIDGKQSSIFDPSRYSMEPCMDVHPHEAERLDIVARFDNEDFCYGWSNESYFSVPLWKNNNWKMFSNRYLVRVTIKTSGEKCVGFFRIVNDVPQNAFRLETASPDEIAKIQKSMSV